MIPPVPQQVVSDVFKQRLVQYCTVNLPLRVTGPVQLDGAILEKSVALTGITFVDHVSMRGCHVQGRLELTNCIFENGLDLSHIEIDEDLKITGRLTTHPQGDPDFQLRAGGEVEAALILDHAHIYGSLKLEKVTIQGAARESASLPAGRPCLSGTGTTIDGDCTFLSIVFKPPKPQFDFIAMRIPGLSASTLKFDLAEKSDFEKATGDAGAQRDNRIDGRIEAFGVKCSGSLLIKGLEAGSMNFSMGWFATIQVSSVLAQTISFQHSDCTDLTIENVFCDGDLDLGGVTCESILSIEGDHGKEFATERPLSPDALDNTYVRGDVRLWGVTVKVDLAIFSARVDGLVRLTMAHLRRAMFRGEPEAPLHFGALSADGATIDTDCFLLNIEVGGSDVGEYTGKLQFVNCKVGGAIRIWEVRRLGKRYGRTPIGWAYPDARTNVARELRIERCTVGGDLDLTRVFVGDDSLSSPGSESSGGIVLDHTKVSGRVRFASPESIMSDPNGGDDSKEARDFLHNNPRPADDRVWAYDAITNFLRMDGLEADEVDLTGLVIRRDPRRPNKGDREAEKRAREQGVSYRDHVQADGVTIRRDFMLYIEDGCRSAEIPGALRLSRASIGKLIVAADTFDDDDSSLPERDGLVLSESTVGHLEMPYRVISGDNSNGFPVPLDLTDAKIGGWTFGNAAAEAARGHIFSYRAEYDLSNNYLDVLDNDRTFSRNVYRSVVKRLRDEGRQNAAVRIHYAEHYRAFWEPRGGWAKGDGRIRKPFGTGEALWWALAVANGRLLRFGASPIPLIGLILFLGMLSFFMVSADSRNFELTLANRQIIASQDRRDESQQRHPGSRLFSGVNLARDVRPCDDGEVLGPQPDKWTALDAIWVTIRYHVPIVSVVARDDVVPTDDRGIILALRPVAELFGLRTAGTGPNPTALWTQNADGYATCPGGAVTGTTNAAAKATSLTNKMGISPEDWFQLMAILNWIMWPILITALIRRLLVPEE